MIISTENLFAYSFFLKMKISILFPKVSANFCALRVQNVNFSGDTVKIPVLHKAPLLSIQFPLKRSCIKSAF